MRTKSNHGIGDFRSCSTIAVNDCKSQKEEELFLLFLTRFSDRNNYDSGDNAEKVRLGGVH